MDQAVGATESRASTEHQAHRPCIKRSNGRERPCDVNVLLHQRRAWQAKVLLYVQQVLQGGINAQGPAPWCRHAADERSAP